MLNFRWFQGMPPGVIFEWFQIPGPQDAVDAVLEQFCNKVCFCFSMNQIGHGYNKAVLLINYFDIFDLVCHIWKTNTVISFSLLEKYHSNDLAHVIKTTKFTNSESPIFCLLAWSTVGQDTLQFINWNHATFSNSF